MLIQYIQHLTSENIYLWCNFGVLPFWVLLILLPNSRYTQILINSVVIPLILTAAYIFIVYQSFILGESFLDIFNLYIGLDNLYAVLSEEYFLLAFWLHFLSLNLFVGSWMSRDGFKYNIPKSLVFLPLILVYFSGPLGIVLYWLIRIFYAKKLGFHD
ncbi:ABA4-like family protein [bacterium]|nr:ABA4-like family protein [bacterium]